MGEWHQGWEEVADFALDWALHPREINEGL